MALSLIINLDGYVSIADKNLGIRWGNCSLEYPSSKEDGLRAVYSKYLNSRKAENPEFVLYSDLAYQPILKWSEE